MYLINKEVEFGRILAKDIFDICKIDEYSFVKNIK
jgi:hypothetical protein